jgi:hypothetical protein
MSSVSFAPYIYTPLRTPTSIRLIQLLPGKENSPLQCNIIQSRRKRIKALYEALSYAWGEANFTQRLSEAGTNTFISITESLHEALQALRDEKSSRWLWVDAVCIAQGNIQEKNHQVRQMANIFREAESVIVWTGKDDYLDTFKKLMDVGRSCQKAIETGYASDTKGCIENEEVYMALRRCDFNRLEDIFDRPWFSRVWTVQEFVLAKQSFIHVGRTNMACPLFSLAVRACADYIFKFHDRKFYPGTYRIQRLIQFRDVYKNGLSCVHYNTQNYSQQKESRLWQCLNVLDRRQCSNEQDKFYSVLGLLPNHLGVSPNYDLPLFDVRMDVTKKMLLAQNLQTLDCAETFMNTSLSRSDPSFLIRVPFSEEKPLSVSLQPFPLDPEKCRGILRHSVIFDGHPAEDTGPHTIGLQGVAIDRVIGVVFCKEDNDTYQLSSDEGLLDDCDFKPLLSNLRGIREYVSGVHLSPDEPKSPGCNELERCFWRTITFGNEEIECGEINGSDTLLQNFELSRYPSRQRVFFVTELGLFGLCSRWTRTGDHMVFFQGALKPHMLRPEVAGRGEKMWKLIGDCYVDNSMAGHCIAFDGDDTDNGGVEEGPLEPQICPNFPRRKRLFAEQFVLC